MPEPTSRKRQQSRWSGPVHAPGSALALCERRRDSPANLQADTPIQRVRLHRPHHAALGGSATWWLWPASDQSDQTSLRVAIAVDVSLGRLDGSVACEQLDVPQGAACPMNEPRRPGNE